MLIIEDGLLYNNLILVLKNKFCTFGFLIFASWNIIKPVHAFAFSLLNFNQFIYFICPHNRWGWWVNNLPNPSQVIIKDRHHIKDRHNIKDPHLQWRHRHIKDPHVGRKLVSLRDGKYISLLYPVSELYISLSLRKYNFT